MATQVQFRRGTTTQNNAFTGAIGEITYDTEVKTFRLHDGVTPGGGAILINNTSAQTLTNKTLSTNSVWNGQPVGLGYGGTGASLSAASGAVAYSTNSSIGFTGVGSSGQLLVSSGSGVPAWVSPASITAGTSSTAVTATNIAGGSAGYLPYQADTGTTSFIAPGASGTFLISTGASSAPSWAAGQITVGSTAISLGSTSASLAGLDILTATGSSNWKIPVGSTGQRPVTPATGMIRYNSTLSSFEGYAAAAWASLGGVKSVDGFTFIIAETSASASNGDLDFYAEDGAGTASTQVGQWNRTNLKDYTGTLVGTQTTQNVFNVTATTLNIGGAATTVSLGAATGTTTVNNNLTVTGNLTINGTTTTLNATSLSIDDNIIRLAEGNPANILDIGFVGNYTSGSALHTGLIKQASSAKWLLISGIAEPTNTVSLTGAVYDWLKLGTVEVTTGVAVNGSTSGTTTLVATAVAGTTTLTLPAATDTLVGKATTDTLTNKTINLTNNTLTATSAQLATAITDETGTGVIVFGTSPTLTTSVVAGSASMDIFNTVATTVNAFGAASTLSIGAATGTLTLNNANTVITGNLTVNGTTTTVNSSTVNLDNLILQLGGDTVPTVDNNLDRGVQFRWFSGTAKNGFFGFDDSTGFFTFIPDATNTGGVLSGTLGVIDALRITGSAATLTTPRNINGTAFDGSAAITTASWGTARTITLGGTGKSVDGSVAVTWTIPEIIPTNTSIQLGSIGVGTAASGTAGEIRATGTITGYYSDDRLKTRTGNIENALEKVLSLDGFHYHANETAASLGYDSSKQEVGLSAQQVQAVLPEIVVPAPIDATYLTIHYERMIPLLVEAIKEQQKQIEELKAKLGN